MKVVADKLFNGSLSLKLKVLVAVALAAGIAGLVPHAEAQGPQPEPEASQIQPPRREGPCMIVFGIVTCLDKTVSPNPATVGQPLTFTITETDFSPNNLVGFGFPLIDTLPSGVRFVSVTNNGGFVGGFARRAPPCTFDPATNTVTCPPPRFIAGPGFPGAGATGVPFVATITVIPEQCGTFTNTVTRPNPLVPGFTVTVEVPFTVNCQPQPPCPPASQEFDLEDVQSGDVEPSVGIRNAGNNANLSPAALQSANTGNIQNAQGVVQSCSVADAIEFEGSSITLSPELESESTQTIGQAAATD